MKLLELSKSTNLPIKELAKQLGLPESTPPNTEVSSEAIAKLKQSLAPAPKTKQDNRPSINDDFVSTEELAQQQQNDQMVMVLDSILENEVAYIARSEQAEIMISDYIEEGTYPDDPAIALRVKLISELRTENKRVNRVQRPVQIFSQDGSYSPNSLPTSVQNILARSSSVGSLTRKLLAGKNG